MIDEARAELSSWRVRLPDGLLIAALVTLTLLVYGPVLGQFFAGTDTFPLIETGRLSSMEDAARLLARPLMAGTGFTSIARYYRPVSSLSYGLDQALWGLNPAGYHWTTLAAHTLNSVLLYLLLRTQGKASLLAAGLGAAIFLLHPAMRDVIPVTSRRQDVLALMFGMLALLAHRSWVQRPNSSRWLLLVAVGLLAMAILAKELAVVFAVLLPADRLFIRYQHSQSAWANAQRAAREAGPYLGLLGGLIALRWIVLGGLGGEGGRDGFTGIELARRSAAIILGFGRELSDPEERIAIGWASAGQAVILGLAMTLSAVAAWCRSQSNATSRSTPGTEAPPEANSSRCGRAVVPLQILAVLLTAWAVWLAAGLQLEPGSASGSGLELLGVAALGGWLALAIGLAAVVAGSRAQGHMPLLPLGVSLRRAAYYALWVILPLMVYLLTSTFSARLVYLPAAGLAAVVAVAADDIGRCFAASVMCRMRRLVLAGVFAPLVLFAVGLLLTSSPLVRGLGEWPVKAHLASVLLGTLEEELGAETACPTIVVRGLPDRGALGLEAYSLQSWLRLRYPGSEARIELKDRVKLDYIPQSIDLISTGCVDGKIEILARPQ